MDADDLDPDPARQLVAWLDEARAAGVPLAETMTLATATADGAPSARMVLLKGVDDGRLVFYTGYESRKAAELAANPRAAVLLHWQPLGRQVRAEGRVERVPAAESDEYFASRPEGSRLGAWASRQSEPIGSRAELERSVEEARARFGAEPPRPGRWGGYALLPEAWEFWQHRDDRLHDRVRYRRAPGGWRRDRLAP